MSYVTIIQWKTFGNFWTYCWFGVVDTIVTFWIEMKGATKYPSMQRKVSQWEIIWPNVKSSELERPHCYILPHMIATCKVNTGLTLMCKRSYELLRKRYKIRQNIWISTYQKEKSKMAHMYMKLCSNSP